MRAAVKLALPLIALSLSVPAWAQGQRPPASPPPVGPLKQPSGAQQQQPAPSPPKPYKAVAITLPTPMSDPGFDALRKDIGEAAKKKDKAALAKLVVAKGFFWERENGEAADKKKPGADNLAVALGLGNKEAPGWDMLAGYSEDPTASPSPTHKGAVCAPADPGFNGKEMETLVNSTQTDVAEWGYPVSNGVEVRASAQPNAPVTEKLGLHFVRVMPDAGPSSAGSTMRIVTPSGKVGFVASDAIAPLGNDQLCYVKEGGGWKIGGYIGGGDAQ